MSQYRFNQGALGKGLLQDATYVQPEQVPCQQLFIVDSMDASNDVSDASTVDQMEVTGDVASSPLQQLQDFYEAVDPSKRCRCEELLTKYTQQNLCEALVTKYDDVPRGWIPVVLTLASLLGKSSLASSLQQLPLEMQEAAGGIAFSRTGHIRQTSLDPLLKMFGLARLTKAVANTHNLLIPENLKTKAATLKNFTENPIDGAEMFQNGSSGFIVLDAAPGHPLEKNWKVVPKIVALQQAADPGSFQNLAEASKASDFGKSGSQ